MKVLAPERNWFVYRITMHDLPSESELLWTISLYNVYCFAECAISSLADLWRLIILYAILLGLFSFKPTKISWVPTMYTVFPKLLATTHGAQHFGNSSYLLQTFVQRALSKLQPEPMQCPKVGSYSETTDQIWILQSILAK